MQMISRRKTNETAPAVALSRVKYKKMDAALFLRPYAVAFGAALVMNYQSLVGLRRKYFVFCSF